MTGIDLHIHTNASDGTCDPKQIIDIARSSGLHTIGITDQDSIDSVEEAVSIGKKAKVTVVPGVELKVKNEPERGLKDVEILGYFLELKNEKLLATLQKRQESKIRKTTRQVELIERNG